MKLLSNLALSTLALGLALVASAEAREIAGLGSCAEADPVGLAIGLGDVSKYEDAQSRGVSSAALGPARHRFTPTPVSANAGGPAMAPPSPGNAIQVGACNSASSVCGGAIQPTPRPRVPVARAPRPRPRRSAPVILVDPDPNTGCGGPGFPCR